MSKSPKKKTRSLPPQSWEMKKLERILDKFSGLRIGVIGDVGVDRYTIGTVERISPEAPVPIVFVQEEKLKLGLAANVADNIVALGATPDLVGVVGKDRGADDFYGLIKKNKIPSQRIFSDTQRKTILKERIVSDRQQLLRVDYESVEPLSSATEKQIAQQIPEFVRGCSALIIEDYAKGLLTPLLAKSVLEEARKSKCWVAVDPNRKTALELYRGANLLTPNLKEAENLSDISITDERTLLQAGEIILQEAQAESVVITRGKEGMALFQKGESDVWLIPTFAREVYDVSGAGDTVIAVLTLAHSAGASLEDAAVLGNLAAGVGVGKRGTATVTRDEIVKMMQWFQKEYA